MLSESTSNRPDWRALAVALFAFVMLGLVDGALGVAWPSMRGTFGRGLSDLGLLLAFGSVGYLTTSAGYGRLHDRFGTGILLRTGSVVLACGVIGLATAPDWLVVAVSAILVGLGGALIDTGMNAHAALVFDVGSISLLHACYGLGAAIGPVVITVSLVSTGLWRGGYAALAVLQLVSAATVWMLGRRWAGVEPYLGREGPGPSARLRIVVMVVLFFLYTGVEVATGQWAFTLLTEGRGMATAEAGLWVAVYWAGLTIGRFGLGAVGDRVSPRSILDVSMVVSLSGIGLLWLDPGGLGSIGLPLAGIGFAGIFPTLVSVTPSRIGRDASTRSMGFQLAAANLGAAVIPWALGLLAELGGLSALAPGLFVSAALLAAVHLAGGRPWLGQVDFAPLS